MSNKRPELTFARAQAGRVYISPAALATMRLYAQHDPKAAEAGGILLGRHIRNAEDIVVDSFTTPMPGDQRSRYKLWRAPKRHQQVINRVWKESEGTCAYVGEWHTHPEPVPTPSSVDLADWKRKLREDEFAEPIFFLIVGTAKICAWEGRRSVPPTRLREVRGLLD